MAKPQPIHTTEQTMALIEGAFCQPKGKAVSYKRVVKYFMPHVKKNVLDHIENECRTRASRLQGEASTALIGMADWIARGAQ